ncbi:MAG TPA: class II aldolase/adducin family protein, partial [Candidatus Limnocylindrales bacterium]|nr:class II aldolase/adducin family protein [Candidatus Limnocylindrales bacterium]
MDINQAKDSVISAGKKLLESGLIARTWGNVSCRLSDHQFVITPSGRPYETLTPNEIVSVNIIDCGFEGAIEPSSEKGVHAVIYGQRSDINFIIHTHQLYASAVSPLQTDIPVTSPTAAAMIGDRVICAPYALPGTKTITQTFAASLARSTGKAFLMAYHGAICFGKNYEETFQVAALLEKVCKDFIKHRYLRLSGQKEFDCDRMRAFYVSKSAGVKSLPCSGLKRPLYNSERSGEQIILYLNGTAAQPFPDGEQKLIRFDITVDNDLRPYNLPAEAAVHRE